jgi:small GTP-binding protein
MKSNEYLIKIFLIGDNDVGKSSILKQFIDNKFDDITYCIIGIDFRSISIEIENQPVKLIIWDPAGQARFRDITRLYYKNTNIVIFVYSITDRKSFNNIIEWLEDIEKYTPSNVYKVLIGNKIDLESKRKVSLEEGEIFSKIYKINMFLEASAKANTNIKEIFINSVKNIIEEKSILSSKIINLQIDNTNTKISTKRKCFSC